MHRFSLYVKFAVECIVRFFVRTLGWIVPVKNNQILCYSFTGNQYSCSPKYITEYLLEHCGGQYEIIWAFRNVGKFEKQVPASIKCVKYQGLLFFFYHLSAKVIISNIYPFHLIPTKRSQVMIDTWHGGGAYKRSGIDFEMRGDKRITTANFNFFRRNITTFLSSSQAFTECFIRSALGFDGNVINSGLPRSDVFFYDSARKAALRKKVFDSLHIDENKKIVLYAPTWRTEDEAKNFTFGTEKLKKSLHSRFGGEWVVLVRMHMYTKTTVSGSVTDAKDYPDMQELLIAADVFITDYSSTVWDISLTDKPCFLYVYDLDRYETERNFYIDIKKWGFPLCKSFEELLSAVEAYDSAEHQKNMKYHNELLGGYEKGNACEIVAGYIEGVCGMSAD